MIIRWRFYVFIKLEILQISSLTLIAIFQKLQTDVKYAQFFPPFLSFSFQKAVCHVGKVQTKPKSVSNDVSEAIGVKEEINTKSLWFSVDP